MLHAVIMAGGSGTRFWPQSRRSLPKQLQPLLGERTLLQQAGGRLNPLVPAERTWVVTNTAQADETRRQLPDVPAGQVLEEPVGRNTAPCIGLAAIHLLEVDPDAVMLVLPADHVIGPDETFRGAAEAAAGLVALDPDSLVLFGVPPAYPATGFGYIQRGEPLKGTAGGFAVAAFCEKPDRATAEEYLAAGDYYWNCGIFAWRADRILAAIREFEPEIHGRLLALQEQVGSERFGETLGEEFPQMTAISIDYAVLERAEGVCVLEAVFDWDDVGSWQALSRLAGVDEQDNTRQGTVVAVDSRNCIIRGEPDHLVAAVGVEDLVIVHTPDATLVARRDDEEGIRRLVQAIQEQGLERYL